MNKEEFKRAGKILFELGFAGPGCGSISVREGDSIFITRKDAMLSSLSDEDIIEVPLNLQEISANSPGELAVHRAIYSVCDATAIINAFPSSASALSLSTEGKILPQDMEGQAMFRGIPVARIREGGSIDDVLKIMPPIFGSGYICAVVKGSASYSTGKNLDEALRRLWQVEQSSKVLLFSRMLNHKPAAGKPMEGRKHAIPPSIGVMDRRYDRGIGRGPGERRR